MLSGDWAPSPRQIVYKCATIWPGASGNGTTRRGPPTEIEAGEHTPSLLSRRWGFVESMEDQTNTKTNGSQIPHWIWMLAGCAIAGGVLVMALVVGHCLRSQKTSSTACEQQQALDTITETLEPLLVDLEDTHAGLFQHFNGVRARHSAGLGWSVAPSQTRGLPPLVLSQLATLRADVDDAVEEVEACRRWRSRLDSVLVAQRAAKRLAGTALQGLRHRVRALLSGVSPQAGATQRQLEDALHQIDKQIVLIGEQRNQLPFRKLGQQIASTMGFIEGALDKVRDDAGEDAESELRSTLDLLQLALLGPKSSPDGEATKTGFVEAHWAWMKANSEGDALDVSFASRIAELHAGHATLDRLMGEALVAAHESVRARVHMLWLTCLAIAAVVGSLFMVLVTSVIRRTREQVSALITAEQEAGETARAQARFLASMSHEIRTPMNGVLGMAELLEGSQRLSDDHQKIAHTIRSSAEALLTVINDVLDFSKIQEGKLELEAADFDLRDMLGESLELLQNLATTRGNQLLHRVDPDVPNFLLGDPDRLRQILLNLCGNAIKFTQDGEVEVHVGLKNAHREIVQLEVSVRDTGVGMSEQAQAGLFKSFVQVGNTSTQRVGGTGLGLTISKRLVQLMGGDLSVQSEQGVGSTFTFTITLKRAHTQSNADFSGRNILIVSSVEASWEELALRLLPWKLGLDVAEDVDEALSLLRQVGAFHLCVLDLRSEDSLELASKIAEDDTLSSTHCLVLSFEHAPTDENATVDAWLTKPVDELGLAQCLQSILGTSTSPAPNANRTLDTGAPITSRILVAEDNAINQRVLKEMLRRLGCTAEFAENGLQAVERVRDHDYDIVLMDCQMPEMDGFAATRAIRALEGRQDLPIIALTANVLPVDRRACEEAGYERLPEQADQEGPAARRLAALGSGWSRGWRVACCGLRAVRGRVTVRAASERSLAW